MVRSPVEAAVLSLNPRTSEVTHCSLGGGGSAKKACKFPMKLVAWLMFVQLWVALALKVKIFFFGLL